MRDNIFKSKTANGILDDTLRKLNRVSPKAIGINDISSDIISEYNAKNIQDARPYVESMLDFLRDEKYIEKNERDYLIKFKGIQFIENGGYVGEAKRIKNAGLLNKVVFCLTGLVALGTAVAGIYYGLEIWKYFHTCHCCH